MLGETARLECHGATSVDQFRKEGFLPEAMVNYLCLLGWNDDTEQDIYSVGELTDAFSLDRVTKSPAVFDMKKPAGSTASTCARSRSTSSPRSSRRSSTRSA